MATTRTPNALLQKPATADRYWDVPLNANTDFLDGVAAIGRLVVTPTEVPSATLNVRVTAGTYIKADGTIGSFAGINPYALPASSVLALWLTDAGVFGVSAAFPTSPHVRLATVVTGPASVQSITDERTGPQTCGPGAGLAVRSGNAVAGPFSIVPSGTGGAALVLNPDTPAVGFFGVAPATQAPALTPLIDHTTGTASDTVADVGSAFSQTQIDNNFAVLTAKVNALITALKRHGLMAS